MATDRIGFFGAAAGARPILSTILIGAGVAALCAFGADRAAAANGSALALLGGFLVAYCCAAFGPAALASAAPRRFPIRVAYGGLAALTFMAASYATSRWGVPGMFDSVAVDAGLAIGAVAAALLSIGAGIWRNEIQLSIGGLGAVMLGVAGGLALLDVLAPSASGALAGGGSGAQVLRGPLTGAASAAASIVATGVAARFAREFAAGGTTIDSASIAADEAAAFALFSAIVVGAGLLLSGSIDAGGSALRFAMISGVFVGGSALFAGVIGAGACGLRRPDEDVAVVENRRREAWGRAFLPLRSALPVSTALAVVAIGAIVSVVACFESAAARDLALWSTAAAAFAGSALSFFSLRTALFAGLTLCLLAAPLAAILAAGGTAMPPDALVVGVGLAAVTICQLGSTWRARCQPRRKPAVAAQLAFAQGAPTHLAALGVGVSALLAAGISGAWPNAYVACGVFIAFAVSALLVAPAVMTVIGAATQRW